MWYDQKVLGAHALAPISMFMHILIAEKFKSRRFVMYNARFVLVSDAEEPLHNAAVIYMHVILSHHSRTDLTQVYMHWHQFHCSCAWSLLLKEEGFAELSSIFCVGAQCKVCLTF
jgi:hypothetical protein